MACLGSLHWPKLKPAVLNGSISFLQSVNVREPDEDRLLPSMIHGFLLSEMWGCQVFSRKLAAIEFAIVKFPHAIADTVAASILPLSWRDVARITELPHRLETLVPTTMSRRANSRAAGGSRVV